MHINFQHLIGIIAILLIRNIQADVVPYLALRSQGINGAREMVGWQTHINKFDMDQNYVTFSITPECSRSFRTRKLGQALFCDAITKPSFITTTSSCNFNDNSCNCTRIKIQGTKVITRDPKSLMAENFYLPTDFSSEITFEPVITNFIVDFNFFCGFDEWLEGLYLRIHTPLCYSRWNLNMCEHIIDKGSENYDVGYFNDTFAPADYTNPRAYGIPRNLMLENFTDFVCAGNSIQGIPDSSYAGLTFSRMNTRHLSETRLAEITAALGYNFLLDEDYYLGFNIRTAAPTGNTPKAQWLFEPIVGNGHHWELGIGMDSSWCVWRSEEEDQNVTMYLDATLTHLFKTTQIRTFDLHCKPLSRYMLATKFSAPADNLIVGSTIPDAQFANVFTPVANLTTGPCSVSANVQGEVTWKVAYTRENFQWDIGYNFWGRSCQKISRCNTNTNFEHSLWGLKGDAFMYGFPATFNPTIVQPQGIPLSATQHNASIFQGTNRPYDSRFIQPSVQESSQWNMNLGVDSPADAYDISTLDLATHMIGETDPSTEQALWTQVQSSQKPIFITEDDLNIQGAQTNSYSNKLFMHLSYTWQNIPDWMPYLGAGWEMEFGSQEQCCCKSSSRASCQALACSQRHKPCSSCRTLSLTQWGIWIKTGFTFQ
jgi:hypothetical protein